METIIYKIIRKLKRVHVNLWVYVAQHVRGKRLIKIMWKFAGLNFNGREIRRGCYFDYPELISIDEGTFVNYGCIFHTSGGDGAYIRIGKNCDLAPQCMFMCTSHEIGNEDRRAGNLLYDGITIGDGCWIGTRVTVLPGVNIGNGVVVAAGSLVNKCIPDNCLVAGNPAKIVRYLDNNNHRMGIGFENSKDNNE